jgi:hypothetical protein
MWPSGAGRRGSGETFGQPVAGVGWERARVGVGVARDRFAGSVGERRRPAAGLHGSAGRCAPGARLR